MKYYIEVPFGSIDNGAENKAEGIGDDMLRVKGITFLQISGRQFERITKGFREQAWSHQIIGVKDSEDEDKGPVLGILLMEPRGDFPGVIYQASPASGTKKGK